MITYLLKTLGAHFRGGRVLYGLTVLGVTVGVASVLGIQVINRNATAAFEGTVDAVSGAADLSIVATGLDLPDSALVTTLSTPGVRYARPFIRTDVFVAEADRWLDLVGVDLLTPVGAAAGVGPSLDGANLGDGWIGITVALAEAEGWAPGDTIQATVGVRTFPLVIGEVYTPPDDVPVSERLAFTDIAQAQARFGRSGRVNQIDVFAFDGVNLDSLSRTLEDGLGPVARVTSSSETKVEANGLLAAFRLNLTALSLISILVGFFLVYAATHAALNRRRHEFGVLRSLGTSRRQVTQLVLAEVGLLGVLGVTLGIPAGVAVANAGMQSVSSTLTNLYLLEAVQAVELDAGLIMLAIGVGLAGTVAGAGPPLAAVLRRNPASLMQTHPHARGNNAVTARGPLMAAALAAATLAWFLLGGADWPPAGFVLCLMIVVCLTLLAPWVVHRAGRSVRVRSFGMRYALRSMSANAASMSIAVASLAVAVTMLVGVTVMIQSFRATLEEWIGNAVRADVYVSSQSWRGRSAQDALTPDVVERLTSYAGVRAADEVRGFRGRVNDRPAAVAGITFGGPTGVERFPLKDGTYAGVTRGARNAILVSEPLARKNQVGPGDSVVVSTPTGDVPVRISGVYYDYGNEQGGIVADAGFLAGLFGNGDPTGVALYLNDGLQPEAFLRDIESAFAGLPLTFRSNRSIRDEAFAVFDQTFAITALLQALSLAIAAIGVTITLLVSARERLSELALYRAIGATRRQIFRVFVGNGLNISFHGIALGLVGGAALAWILIEVINPGSFGWTIRPSWTPGALVLPLATVVGAAALASLYPAVRAARVPATELTNEDR